MRSRLAIGQAWTKLIASTALGAAFMYIFDPGPGRQRRALARDKALHLVGRTGDGVNIARRDLKNRVQGIGARLSRLIMRKEAPDDRVLVDRVRAKFGRFVANPH